jgi:hypothetical protein
MQDAGCKMQDARCRMQDAGCRMQDAGCKMQDARCESLNADISPFHHFTISPFDPSFGRNHINLFHAVMISQSSFLTFDDF